MNIYLPTSIQNKTKWKGETNRYINQEVKYTHFVGSFKTPK